MGVAVKHNLETIGTYIDELENEKKRLRLLAVEHKPKISDIANILGVTTKAVHSWGFKKGATFAEIYDFIEVNKPALFPLIERYVEKNFNRKLALYEI